MENIIYVVIDKSNYFNSNLFIKDAIGTKASLKKKNISMKLFASVKDFETSFTKVNWLQDARIRLMWHLSSSDVSLSDFPDAINTMKKYIPAAELRIGKSESTTFQDIAKADQWFQLVGSGSSLNTKFRMYNWDIDKLIGDLPSYKKATHLNEIATEVLTFLLPLFLDARKIHQFYSDNKYDEASERLNKIAIESLGYYRTIESKLDGFLNNLPKSKDKLSKALATLNKIAPNLIKSLGLLGKPKKVTKANIEDISNFQGLYERIRNELKVIE